MAYTKSDDLKDDNLDNINTRAANGNIVWRTGARPASPTNSATGTTIATFPLGAVPFDAPASGSMTLDNIPMEVNASGSGTVGYVRVESSGGAGIVDLTVTTTGGGGDATMTNTSVTNGEPVRINTFTLHG